MLPGRPGSIPDLNSTNCARSRILPCYLAAFQTSNLEVPNAARSTGSIRDLTGAIPDLTGAIPDLPGSVRDLIGAIPDLPGSIRDLKFVKSARSGTLPVDLAVLGTSKLEVRNAARSNGSVRDLRTSNP